jgi:hypothetical protein
MRMYVDRTKKTTDLRRKEVSGSFLAVSSVLGKTMTHAPPTRAMAAKLIPV